MGIAVLLIHFPAGTAGLGYLHNCAAQTEGVADMDFGIGESAGGNILTDRAGDETVTQVGQSLFEQCVMLSRVVFYFLQ